MTEFLQAWFPLGLIVSSGLLTAAGIYDTIRTHLSRH